MKIILSLNSKDLEVYAFFFKRYIQLLCDIYNEQTQERENLTLRNCHIHGNTNQPKM